MMKAIWVTLILGVGLVCSAGLVHAVSLEIKPTNQIVAVGNQLGVEIAIAGLGDRIVPSLREFDITLTFNPSILTISSFTNVVVGDPVLGNQLGLGLGPIIITLFGNTVELPGSIHIGGFSPDKLGMSGRSFRSSTELDTLQAKEFTLFSVLFDTVTPGLSLLELRDIELKDSLENPISATIVGNGSVHFTAAAVPEPATFLLFGPGLIGIGVWRYSTKQCRK